MASRPGEPCTTGGSCWRGLGAPPHELHLDFCLPTGQSFRWRQTGSGTYTGVIGNRLVVLRQTPDDVEFRVLARGSGAAPEADGAALREYFNLDTRLADLAPGWAARCARFAAVAPHFPGARMLRQDPLECLFQFICSSNNHISRIHGMVERLCSAYGTPLAPAAGGSSGGGEPCSADDGAAGGVSGGSGGGSGGGGAGVADGGLAFYAFPTLEQLSAATEEELRAAGFGYRARFIVGTTQALRAKPGGGREWLLGLRGVGLEEAVEALTELPGIGPKVAACICLFSLDKHAAIPVDTHVWQIAVRHYAPGLAGRSLTKKLHGEVARLFVERFGPYAGWAHNTLFISELASQQHRLPEGLRHAKAAGAGRKKRSTDDSDGEAGDDAPGSGNGSGDEAGGAGKDGGDAEANAGPAVRGSGRKKNADGAGSDGSRQQQPARSAGKRISAARAAISSPGDCVAVADGQTELGTPVSRRARGRAEAAAPQKKRGGRSQRQAAGAAYVLGDFDDLAA